MDGGADFEHRIVGMRCARVQRALQNRRFSEIACKPKLIEVSFWLFRKVVETHAPLAYLQRTQSDTFKLVYTLAEMSYYLSVAATRRWIMSSPSSRTTSRRWLNQPKYVHGANARRLAFQMQQ